MSEPTPVYELAAKAGAVFEENAGWLLAAHYGNPLTEYEKARNQAGLFDMSHRGKIEMTGPDGPRFLHNLCTNDVVKLPAGSGCEAFLPTGQAKVVAHVLIYRGALADGQPVLWLDVAPGAAEKVVRHLEHYHITEQVELTDRTRALAQLHLAGPQAQAVLQRLLPDGLPHLGELQHLTGSIGGTAPCQIRRHDALGLPGYDILCPHSGAATVWQTLTGAGAVPAGLQTYQALRVEAGTPLDGVDIDETNLPQEVGRTEQAISFT